VSKRRQFTPEFKARMVLEELTGIKDQPDICREHRLSPQALAQWREELLERASEIFCHHTMPSPVNKLLNRSHLPSLQSPPLRSL